MLLLKCQCELNVQNLHKTYCLNNLKSNFARLRAFDALLKVTNKIKSFCHKPWAPLIALITYMKREV